VERDAFLAALAAYTEAGLTSGYDAT